MSLPITRLLRRRTPRVLLLVTAVVVGFAFYGSREGAISGYSLFRSGESEDDSRTSLIYQRNGLATGWKEDDKSHPIEALMEKGRKKYERLLRRQSKTLAQAVHAYKERYGRNPPKGFDKWWEWAVEHNVTIKDDYDRIFKDTNLYWAIPPPVFREKVEAIFKEPSSFRMHLDPTDQDACFADGTNPNARADAMLDLLVPIASNLPEIVDMVVSTHDLGSWIIGDDQRIFLENKIANREYATAEELKPFENANRHKAKGLPGFASACPEDSPAWIQQLEQFALDQGKKKGPRPVYEPTEEDRSTFIHDHSATFDYCYHPDELKFHGELSWDFARQAKLRPLFVQSKFARNPEIALTPLDYYYNATEKGSQNQYLPWSDKEEAKLHWRGKMTGDFYSGRDDYNWRNSHRVRLHTTTHDKEGQRQIYVKSRRTGAWEWQSWSTKILNEAYMDVGLVDGPMQCKKEDGTCDELQETIDWSARVGPGTAATYKYAIDVDGNGWSSRFHRLLLSGSVVLKSTIFPEWYEDWIVPWYHYVPMSASYAEMYTTLSFFIGAPNSPSTGNDALAQQIGERGRQFALDHWRWEDMQSYMFRLLLEYIRLGKEDREDWSFVMS